MIQIKYFITIMLLLILICLPSLSALASEEWIEETQHFTAGPDSCKYRHTVIHKITTTQLIVGAVVTIGVFKIIFGCPDAFYDVEPPSGWTYEILGDTCLYLNPPDSITNPGEWTFSFKSSQGNIDYFHWKTLGSEGQVLEQGIIKKRPKIPTLTQWGLVILTILVVGSGIWLMLKRRRAIRI